MTDEHKKALAEGRAQGRVVKRYLEALEANKPKRGRKRTPESIEKRLGAINEKLESASAVERLQLSQERIDLERDLERLRSSTDTADALPELEKEFTKVARQYGDRKGLSYAAWREVGVPAPVLKSAGISRSR